MALTFSALPDFAYPEGRVLIIITGGTICMKKSENGLIPATNFLKFGLAPRPAFNDLSYPDPLEIIVNDRGKTKAVQSLRTPISTYGRSVRYAVYEFDHLLDSSSIDAAGWDHIAKSIYWNYQLFDGFVILHGTDSLAYSSSALSFMLQNLGKPVILTGSQASIMELQTDAEANMLNSLIIAGHFMIPEVCLFFNFKLFRGNRTTKVSAEDFDAFGSPNFPPLATISSLRTRIRWDLIHRPTVIHPLSIRTKLDTNHVACLRIFPGIKPEMVDAVLKVPGLKGLVLESFGSGNTPGDADSALQIALVEAVKRGTVIVNVTQCLSGSVTHLYESGSKLAKAGVVLGNDMTSEAALTKLSYLLSLPDLTPLDVAKQMSVSIRGELSDSPRTHFHHPDSGTLTPELSSLTALAYAIQEGDVDHVREVMRGEPRWLLNDLDYAGNTPMVSIEILLDSEREFVTTTLAFAKSLDKIAPNRFLPQEPSSGKLRVLALATIRAIWAGRAFAAMKNCREKACTTYHCYVSRASSPILVPHRPASSQYFPMHPVFSFNCRRARRTMHYQKLTGATQQHLAATGPNVEILADFLSQGASVHLRNREGHTPLFLSAAAGLKEHVRPLKDAGAHLHLSEMAEARLHQAEAKSDEEFQIWELAGVEAG